MAFFVAYGTPQEEIGLPTTLTAFLADGTQKLVNVSWTCVNDGLGGTEYNPTPENSQQVVYTFVAKLAEEAICADGLALPTAEVHFLPSIMPLSGKVNRRSSCTGGKIALSPDTFYTGTDFTMTVTPKDGYVLAAGFIGDGYLQYIMDEELAQKSNFVYTGNNQFTGTIPTDFTGSYLGLAAICVIPPALHLDGIALEASAPTTEGGTDGVSRSVDLSAYVQEETLKDTVAAAVPLQYEIVQVTEVSTEGAETPLTEHNFVSLSGSTLTLAPSYSDAQEEARELRIYLRASRGMAQGEQVALVARIAAQSKQAEPDYQVALELPNGSVMEYGDGGLLVVARVKYALFSGSVPEEEVENYTEGKVQFYIDGEADGEPVSYRNGPTSPGFWTAVGSDAFSLGTHTITAKYLPEDGDYAQSPYTASVEITMEKKWLNMSMSWSTGALYYQGYLPGRVSEDSIISSYPRFSVNKTNLNEWPTDVNFVTDVVLRVQKDGSDYSTSGLEVRQDTRAFFFPWEVGEYRFVGELSADVPLYQASTTQLPGAENCAIQILRRPVTIGAQDTSANLGTVAQLLPAIHNDGSTSLGLAPTDVIAEVRYTVSGTDGSERSYTFVRGSDGQYTTESTEGIGVIGWYTVQVESVVIVDAETGMDMTGQYDIALGTGTLRVAKSLNGANITIATIPAQTYTGGHICPAVSVWDGETQLVMGEDYTVSYQNNVNVGVATVIITGIGDYMDTRLLFFDIVPPQVTEEEKPSGSSGGSTSDSSETAESTGEAQQDRLVVDENGTAMPYTYSTVEVTDEITGTVLARKLVIVADPVRDEAGAIVYDADGQPLYEARSLLLSRELLDAIASRGYTHIRFAVKDAALEWPLASMAGDSYIVHLAPLKAEEWNEREIAAIEGMSVLSQGYRAQIVTVENDEEIDVTKGILELKALLLAEAVSLAPEGMEESLLLVPLAEQTENGLSPANWVEATQIEPARYEALLIDSGLFAMVGE